MQRTVSRYRTGGSIGNGMYDYVFSLNLAIETKSSQKKNKNKRRRKDTHSTYLQLETSISIVGGAE